MIATVRLSLELHYCGIFGVCLRLLHQKIINLSSSLSIYLPHFESIFSIFLSNKLYKYNSTLMKMVGDYLLMLSWYEEVVSHY